MKLSLQGLKAKTGWEGYRLPAYDIEAVREKTAANPTWPHFGAGSMFRAYPAVLAQRLLTAGLTGTGVIVCEGWDEELIDLAYRPFDNLSVAATLHADGMVKKEVIASVTESLKLSQDFRRVAEIFQNPSLQMVTFSITEKAYTLRAGNREFKPWIAEDLKNGPVGCRNLLAQVTALLLARRKTTDAPLALVSLDNCANNGHKLQRAILEIARTWRDRGFISEEEVQYLIHTVSFPLSVIDKITPHPDPRISEMLTADGLEDMVIRKTAKGTETAGFTNAERTQYLLIEDRFPNGRPPLDQASVVFTSRKIVGLAAKMKASTCMNPIDTATGIFGCLLNYPTISAEMQDKDVVDFVTKMSLKEAIPMVADPGVIDPWDFLHEVLTERLPNPYLADRPARIATDTSHKLAVRFGETILAYYNSPVPKHRASQLQYIPAVLAAWLRYLIGLDDEGRVMPLSPDPRLESLRAALSGIELGSVVEMEQIEPILCDKFIFGVNLAEVGLDETVLAYFNEMLKGPGAVRATIKRVCEEN